MKHRLVIIGHAVQSSQVLQECREIFEVSVFTNVNEFVELAGSNLAPYSLWVHFDSHISKEIFNTLPEPDCILTTTTGLTHFSADVLERFGNRIFNLATEREFLQSITSTAEHTWSLLMAITSPWLQYTGEMATKGRSELTRDFQLSSRKIGIIGYGRLGRIMTRYALAFGMQVHIFEIDPTVIIPVGPRVIRHENLEDLLNLVDIVSLHATATFPCKTILSRELLNKCKTGIMIINSSRGCLVDENHIATLIESGAIGFYATDVLQDEEVGIGSTPLALKLRAESRDRVIITPHIGGANIEAMDLCEENLLSRLISRVQTND